MKTIWKVLLGVFLVVFLVALCVGTFFVGRYFMMPGGMMGSFGRTPRLLGPGLNGLMPFFPGARMPFSGMGWLGAGLMLFSRLFIPLAVLALIIILVVALFQRPVSQPAPVQPAPAQSTFSPGGVCSSCGKALQADWKVCPYCGEKI